MTQMEKIAKELGQTLDVPFYLERVKDSVTFAVVLQEDGLHPVGDEETLEVVLGQLRSGKKYRIVKRNDAKAEERRSANNMEIREKWDAFLEQQKEKYIARELMRQNRIKPLEPFRLVYPACGDTCCKRACFDEDGKLKQLSCETSLQNMDTYLEWLKDGDLEIQKLTA